MTLWRITLGQIRRRPGRTALAFLGIVIGVASIVATTMTTQATRRSYREMFETVGGRAALEIVADAHAGFPEENAAHIGRLPNVQAVVPVIQATTALVARSGAVPVLVLGIDPVRDRAARDYQLRAGRPLDGDEGVLVEADFAEAHGLELGKPVRLITPSGVVQANVAGLLESRGVATFNGGAIVVIPLRQAQRFFALEGQINSLQIVATDRADWQRLEREVARQLPTGLSVRAPAMRGQQAQHALYTSEQALVGLSLVSIVAGAFVIFNSFTMNLGERRRQLATLRALGANRTQVIRLLLREAVLLGVAGTVVGVPIGGLIGSGMRILMGQLMGTTPPELHWTAEPLMLATVFGPGMTLAATYVPARRASRRAPLVDLLDRRPGSAESPRRWTGCLGLGLIVGGAALSVALFDRLPGLAIVPLAIGLPLGCVLALPLVLPLLLPTTGWLLDRTLGTAGRLAFRQLDRQRPRTAVTAGVLAISLIVNIGFGHAIRSGIRDIHHWIDRVAIADFYIRGTMPDGAYAVTVSALPESMANEIAAIAGVDRVDYVNWIPLVVQGRQAVLLACTLPPNQPLPLALVEGDPRAVRRGLEQGGTVLGTALARRLGLNVGDTLPIETQQGPVSLQIVGTTNEYTLDGMALVLTWETARQLFAIKGVNVLGVTAKTRGDVTVAERLRTYCAERGLMFHSQAGLRAHIDRSLGGLIVSLWGLLSLLAVVASLGIVNTLTMNILEQTRELGVLRAIGMARAQIRRMIVAQAIAIALLSLVPGLLAGLSLAYFCTLLERHVLAHEMSFHLYVGYAAACVAGAVLVALLAALLPARRAGNLQIIHALHYE